MSKKKVLIIFGGKSGEHEVSVRSATAIEQHLDPEKYESYVLGITNDGFWNFGKQIADITHGLQVLAPTNQVSLPHEPGSRELTVQSQKGLEKQQFDVIFPIIHGPNGEDGKIQGFLEMANLPYVGAGVLGSALAMDKVLQKQLCAANDIPQTKFEWFWRHEWEKNQHSLISKIEKSLTYPMFVKPANMGSSVGINKAKNQDDLIEFIEIASLYDTKILVEQAIPNILEVEVSVLGNHSPEASVCGSIKPNTEFYDYETKYVTDDVISEIPAKIPDEDSEKIRATAINSFLTLNCIGMARVDFFYQPDTRKHYLNELNTLPGFTSISMYPKLWEATGISYRELLAKLIDLAIEAWQEKQQLKHTYK
jgi:D-alanine-D-alanine ligase